jgi:myo-inositol-1-phosphate synthase
MSRKIRVAIAGVGNCASSLVQGLQFYRDKRDDDCVGLLHPNLGGYRLDHIEIVAAFDVDRRKVGKPLNDACVALPNNTKVFHPLTPGEGPVVLAGPVLDGIPSHMRDYPIDQRFEPADAAAADATLILRANDVDVLVNFLPVGSQQASEYYAQACIEAGCAMVNCIPVFLASSEVWASKFRLAGLPIVGDDIKAQVGATITHRTLARMFSDRGASIQSTYQLNTAGNTDFLNMLARERLGSKKISKTQAVQSQLDEPLPDHQIHVGPSDYIPFLKDNKVCFIRIEGQGFGGVPVNLELRLSVEDSPNSAGVVVDAIRCAMMARELGMSGPIDAPSSWCMKHPPQQTTDQEALANLEAFVANYRSLRG